MANIEDIERSVSVECFSYEAHPRVISGSDTGDSEDRGSFEQASGANPVEDRDAGESTERP